MIVTVIEFVIVNFRASSVSNGVLNTSYPYKLAILSVL